MLTVTSWKYVDFCVYSLQQCFLLVVAQLLKERKAQDCSPLGDGPGTPHAGYMWEDVIYGNVYMSSWRSADPTAELL